MQLPENFNDLINDYLAVASQEIQPMPPYPIVFGAMIASAVFVLHNIQLSEQSDDHEPSKLEMAVYNKLIFDMCGTGAEMMDRDPGLYTIANERYKAIRLVAAKCMECGGMDGDE